MSKNKYHLLTKRHSGSFTLGPHGESDNERARRAKRQRRQGANYKWLRTRRRIKQMLLR